MAERRFLFLQGPHGPFFRQLAGAIEAAGADCLRVGFTAGDAAFWWPRGGYQAFRGDIAGWPAHLARLIAAHGLSDLVLYGDTRPAHAMAINVARQAGLRIHVFEEGYLRPYWVTYERDGSNGHSPLMGLPAEALGTLPCDGAETPTGWGDMRQHMFYGAAYHAALLAGRRAYPRYRGHRGISVTREACLNLARFALMPVHALERRIATARLRRGGFPYHLALLQLEHDASFLAHSPYATQSEFIEDVVGGFASGAPRHHHLIFKAHPLEDGRSPLRRAIRAAARAQGIAARVHYLRGGKLAGLLDDTLSAVTINSTAGQQVLRRGIPLRAMGQAIYGRAGFTSDQPLEAFFADPTPPDLAAYRVFRRFLLDSSQIPGGFYSARGRRKLLRRLPDLMLADQGPYATRIGEIARNPGAASAQHLSIVTGTGRMQG